MLEKKCPPSCFLQGRAEKERNNLDTHWGFLTRCAFRGGQSTSQPAGVLPEPSWSRRREILTWAPSSLPGAPKGGKAETLEDCSSPEVWSHSETSLRDHRVLLFPLPNAHTTRAPFTAVPSPSTSCPATRKKIKKVLQPCVPEVPAN